MAKILILSSFPAPYRVEVFKGIARKYDTDVFFATDKDQDRSKDFFVKKCEFNYYVLSEMKAEKKFLQCIKNLKEYDLVLAYDWYLKYALKVEWKCILNRIPYVINCDGAFIDNDRNIKTKIKDIIKSFFIKNAAACFSSGKFATEYFQHYGAKRENIVEHPFSSLKTEEIRKTPLKQLEKDNLKRELNLPEEKCVVTVGQFIYRKGFDVLLNAWKNLDDKYQLVIIGGGTLESEYRKIIKEYGLKHIMLIDFIPKEQILKYLAVAEVFVLPTREDIWGLVINEALAVGTPVITTNKCIAGMELLKNNDCGYIVQVDDVKELEQKMEKILAMDDDQRWRLGINAVHTIRPYTIETIVSQHYKAIEKILTS